MCSRLLLFGFLEEHHTLQANAVEKVANDLREELAVVTIEPNAGASAATPNGGTDAVSKVAERVSILEENVNRHGRIIKRAIELAASYFQSERP